MPVGTNCVVISMSDLVWAGVGLLAFVGVMLGVFSLLNYTVKFDDMEFDDEDI